MASDDLRAKRDKIQRQILALESTLGTDSNAADALSSDSSDNESEDSDSAIEGLSQNNLEAERERVQREIEELENTLCDVPALANVVQESDADKDSSDSDDDELHLPQNVETCLQMNLVYQEVLREKLAELESLLADNQQQQKELEVQLSVPGHVNHGVPGVPPQKQFVGFFMKPYFKDKLTGLGPPANDETRERMRHSVRTATERKLRRWEGWQKTLLTSSVAKDTMKRMLQPKLSKLDYFCAKLSKVENEEEKESIKKQMNLIENQITEISVLRDDQLLGQKDDDHDWEKISNVDFEGYREADDLKRFWQNYLHPSINKSMWKQDELDKLKRIAEEFRCSHWDKIAEALGTNRTAFVCFQTYQRYISKILRRNQWTKEEDVIFKDLVEKMRIGNFIPYTQISHFMVARDGAQLQYRWTTVLDPSIKKGHWSKEEDDLLIKAVARYGKKEWGKIRLEVPGRTDNACRDRYLDCLNSDVKKGTWTEQEIELLKEKVAKYGVGKWSKIASEIPNRHDSQCLHKWVTLTKLRSRGNKRPQNAMNSPTQGSRKRKRRKVSRKKNKKNKEFNSSSEDETKITYMSSDNESDASEKPQIFQIPLKEYVQPDMKDWIPVNGTARTLSPGSLRIEWVRLPTKEEEMQKSLESSALDNTATGNSKSQKVGHRQERYTVLTRYGNVERTFVGIPPIVLKNKTDHRKSMVKVVNSDVRLFLQMKAKEAFQKKKGKNQSQRILKRTKSAQSALAVNYDLFKAISPWVGNVIIPVPENENAPIEGDIVAIKALSINLQKTAVFQYFIKAFQLDFNGCRNVIQIQEEICVKTIPSTKPIEAANSSTESPKTVAQLLMEKQMKFKKTNPEIPPQTSSPKTPVRQMPTPAAIRPNSFVITQQNLHPIVQPVMFQGMCFPKSPTNATSHIPVQPLPQTPSKSIPASTPPRPEESKSFRATSRVCKPSEKAQALKKENAKKNKKGSPTQKKSSTSVVIPTMALHTQPIIGFLSPPRLVQVPLSTPVYGQIPNGVLQSNSLPPCTSIGSPSAQILVASSLSSPIRSYTTPDVPHNMTMSPLGNNLTSSPNIVVQGSVQTVSHQPINLLPNTLTYSPTSSPGQRQNQITANSPPVVFTVLPAPVTLSAGRPAVLNCNKQVVVRLCDVSKKPCITKTPSTFSSQPFKPILPMTPSPVVLPPIITVSDPQTFLNELPSVSVQFHSRLIFPEPSPEVDDWMKGKGGVPVPHLDKSLPYLPPSVATLETLTSLLKVKQSLLACAVKILPVDFKNNKEEDVHVQTIRKIVNERFGSNPAFQLLKARFLSCFTLPALLATIKPTEECGLLSGDEDEDLDFLDTDQGSQLNTNENEALATDFSGIGANS